MPAERLSARKRSFFPESSPLSGLLYPGGHATKAPNDRNEKSIVMTTWVPCSALDSIEEMVWLPRLLQKARRHEAARASGIDLMNGYQYGNNDFIDAKFLKFLRTDDCHILKLVREYADDRTVARVLVERSGRSVKERRIFSAQTRRSFFNFELLEADEGRTPRGLRRTLLCIFYNYLMMPCVTFAYNRAERARNDR